MSAEVLYVTALAIAAAVLVYRRMKRPSRGEERMQRCLRLAVQRVNTGS